MATRYRSKQDGYEVEAEKLGLENRDQLADWCNGVPTVEQDAVVHTLTYPAINVETRYGMKRAQFTHWIARFPNGSFETYTDAQFQSLFEILD